MKSRHLIDVDDMTLEEIAKILDMAKIIRNNPEYFTDSCHGKLMAALFYEPSTRTKMSFQSAMLKLGGKLIGFDDASNSSVSKGESLKDTIRVVSNYADLIVIRHPLEGAAMAAAMFSRVPIINAGDGGHFHPTQTLTDLFTLQSCKGTLSNLTVGLCGDLKYGRTVHSLIKTLCRYENNRFVLISTPELAVPDYIKEIIAKAGCEYCEMADLNEAIGELDVLYMTRIQAERFDSKEEYEKQKGIFVLTPDKLRRAKYGVQILHPLPRVDEIDYAIDDDPRAQYFNQTEYGMYARMALILNMLEGSKKQLDPRPESNSCLCCGNPKCITKVEPYLPTLMARHGAGYICEYCEHEAAE